MTEKPTMLTQRYIEALGYAADRHARQTRKGTSIPYLSHLLAVSSLVMEHGGNEDEAIAGLLHDVIEDVGPHEEPEIRQRFGEIVLEIVIGCTDYRTYPKPPWRARKESYIAHLATASPAIRLVSCCDKLHNATSILTDLERVGPTVFERFSAKRDGTLWYYRALADAFQKYGAPPAKQLADIVALIEIRAA